MTEYYFETKEFGVSDKGIHLLRSRFNYETIGFDEISTLSIAQGREVNNWIVLFVIGLGLFLFSIYYTLGMYNIIMGNEVITIYIEEIIIPVLPFLIGAYFFYASTRNGLMLIVDTIQGKRKRLPLKELVKEGQSALFQQWLREKCSSKLSIRE